MRILPYSNLTETVRTGEPIARRRFASYFCSHRRTTDFVRIDHRAGAGWMADNHKGEVCCDCGKILETERTY